MYPNADDVRIPSYHPMKILLLSLLCVLGITADASAQARYAGKYVAFVLQDDSRVAGVNITIANDGAITGRGTYLDFTEINLTGTVDAAGNVAITEVDGRNDPFSFTATFKANAQKFTARFAPGSAFKAFRLTGGFQQGGVYYIQDDIGEEGVILLDRSGNLLGIIYDFYGDGFYLNGSADAAGFSALSDDDVDYEATFNADDIDGTYDGGRHFQGSFNGSKY